MLARGTLRGKRRSRAARGGSPVGTVLDDEFGPLCGRVPAQIGQALLGHDDLYIVLGVVHMRNHGDDAGDGAALGQRKV